MRGGEGGIRTHGTVARTPDFESGTFDHSATSPGSLGGTANRAVGVSNADLITFAQIRPRREKAPLSIGVERCGDGHDDGQDAHHDHHLNQSKAVGGFHGIGRMKAVARTTSDSIQHAVHNKFADPTQLGTSG